MGPHERSLKPNDLAPPFEGFLDAWGVDKAGIYVPPTDELGAAYVWRGDFHTWHPDAPKETIVLMIDAIYLPIENRAQVHFGTIEETALGNDHDLNVRTMAAACIHHTTKLTTSVFMMTELFKLPGRQHFRYDAPPS